MKETELRQLIVAGETSTLEFKESLKDPDPIKKAICSFANDWQRSGGGRIVVGVTKAGAVKGIPGVADNTLRVLADAGADGSIDPKPPLHVTHATVDGKVVGIVEVSAGQRPPYRWSGTAYIRVGTQVRPATFEEEQELSQRSLAETPEPLPGFLPPRETIAPDFVGRSRELDRLWAWFMDPDTRRCALIGQGGSGKTALAYEFAALARLRAPKPFELVLWASAKRQRLQEKGIVALQPDFWDLDSALRALLEAAGFKEFSDLSSVDDKKARLVEVLRAFPALIIVDDLDTLLRGAQNLTTAAAVDFLVFSVPAQTSSKLIVTSRVDPNVGYSIAVPGFDVQSTDAMRFVNSRLRLFNMHDDALTSVQKRDLLRHTEGIPLYIEDFLRLFKLLGNHKKTAEDWTGHKGDRAREFALRLEFESLTNDAKIVLLACAELDPPVSMEDVRGVTGFGEETIEQAVLLLQGLFLLSLPGAGSEGGAAFALNENTRRLVRSELTDTPEMLKVRAAVKSLTGEIYTGRLARQQVGTLIKKAYWKVRQEQNDEAEGILKQALTEVSLSQHPDLYGALGWVYKVRRPRSAERAREAFRRAAELGSRQPDTYRHWVEMELQEGQWARAVEAAQLGQKALGERAPLAMFLTYSVGYAKSRLGKSLIEGYNVEKGLETLREAEAILRNMLKDPAELLANEWGVQGKAYLALVLNAETYYRATRDPKWGNRIPGLLDQWRREHPDDIKAAGELERLTRRYPELIWKRATGKT